MAKKSVNKRLAVLTSGGDASGMNACIRTVVRYGLNHGFEVYGIKHGYKGMVNDEIFPMDYSSVSNSVHAGGTILRSARCLEFKEKDVMMKAADNLLKRGIEN
ncbi:MAG: 6-phosphofructokinase, partial [Clostridia bacterium]|nr:6-phosphofructokinase [Clostridia bacterium]